MFKPGDRIRYVSGMKGWAGHLAYEGVVLDYSGRIKITKLLNNCGSRRVGEIRTPPSHECVLLESVIRLR